MEELLRATDDDRASAYILILARVLMTSLLFSSAWVLNGTGP